MFRNLTALVTAAALMTSGCMQMTDREGQAAVGGGALAAIALAAITNDPAWVLIGAAAGAAAGAMIARNTSTGECAYADGKGGYYRGECPAG